MGTAVPRPAPREKKPRRPLRTKSELKRARLNPGGKALKRTPMKPGDGKASQIPRPIAKDVQARDTDEYGNWRDQHPGSTALATEKHHIWSKAKFGPKRREERDDLSNLVSLASGSHRLAQLDPRWRDFWRECSTRNLLGEVYRPERDALAKTMGLIERG